MAVDVTKTTGNKAEITWNPHEDDPRGHLALAVETGRLKDALSALGATTIEALGDAAALERIVSSTALLQNDLERRMRSMVVELKTRGMSWSEIAALLYGDSNRRSSARAVYNAGVRQLGMGGALVDEND
ncbi:hypothetical protein ACWCPS_33300 [Streptomyces mauvecolor]